MSEKSHKIISPVSYPLAAPFFSAPNQWPKTLERRARTLSSRRYCSADVHCAPLKSSGHGPCLHFNDGSSRKLAKWAAFRSGICAGYSVYKDCDSGCMTARTLLREVYNHVDLAGLHGWIKAWYARPRTRPRTCVPGLDSAIKPVPRSTWLWFRFPMCTTLHATNFPRSIVVERSNTSSLHTPYTTNIPLPIFYGWISRHSLHLFTPYVANDPTIYPVPGLIVIKTPPYTNHCIYLTYCQKTLRTHTIVLFSNPKSMLSWQILYARALIILSLTVLNRLTLSP